MLVKGIGSLLILLGVVLAACAPPPARQGASGDRPNGARGAPKSVTVAIMADPPIVAKILNPGSHWRGVEHIEALLDAGLTRQGGGGRHAEMAETVPTVENGLWKVNPDGTMEITWKIRDGVQWHDGTPVTSADMMFTMQVGMDRDVPLFSLEPVYPHIAGYEAPDARTVVVRWKDSYIEADQLFGAGDQGNALPIARHLLESAYLASKTGFADNPLLRPPARRRRSVQAEELGARAAT